MHHSIYFFSVDPEKAFADIMGTEFVYLEAHMTDGSGACLTFDSKFG